MANILSIVKITPSSPELDRNELVDQIKDQIAEPNGLEVLKFDEEPLAFGVYNIKLYIRSPDTEEGSQGFNKFEEAVLALEVVAECETELQTLMDH